MLAYHWTSALELVRASGGDEGELAERARLALRDAGDRAYALNGHRVAAAQYDDALALWPEDDAELPNLLFRFARALYGAYDDRAEEALATARDALLAVGDTDLAGEAESLSAHFAWHRGRASSCARGCRAPRTSSATPSRRRRHGSSPPPAAFT